MVIIVKETNSVYNGRRLHINFGNKLYIKDSLDIWIEILSEEEFKNEYPEITESGMYFQKIKNGKVVETIKE